MNKGKLSIVGALLICVSMMLIVLPVGASAATTSTSHVFLTEDAEEATYALWDVRWDRFDANYVNSTTDRDWWCRTMHDFHGATHSIYCAKNGMNPHYRTTGGEQPLNANITALPSTPQSAHILRYDTEQDSIMRKEVVGAQYYNNVTLTFWFYSDTGYSDARQPGSNEYVGYDFLNLIYYTGSGEARTKHVLWTDSYAEATAKTWIKKVVSVPNNLTMIGFEFVSGTIAPEGGDAVNAFTSSGVSVINGGMKEGVFLDDISLVGTDPRPDLPLETTVDTLPTYHNDRSFLVNVSDNDPQVPLKWIDLYYRQSGEEAWTKFTTVLRPDGKFPSSPIDFVAPTDGTFEFFSQAWDQDNALELYRNASDASTMVDTIAPSSNIVISSTNVSEMYSTMVSFNLTSSDPLSGVELLRFRVDGGSWVPYSNDVGISTSGTHVIDYYSTDRAGNVEIIKNASFTINSGSFGIVFPEDGRTYPDGNVTVYYTLASTGYSINNIQYSLDQGAFIHLDPTNASVFFSGLSEGTHHLTVKAIDSSNSTIEGSTSFNVIRSSDDGEGQSGSLFGEPLLLIGFLVGMVIALSCVVWFLKRNKD